jgi:hypothetical protein
MRPLSGNNLNHHIYDISMGEFTAPEGTGTGELGSIAVDISIRHNPEPSSIVLAAISVSAFGCRRLTRRWCSDRAP